MPAICAALRPLHLQRAGASPPNRVAPASAPITPLASLSEMAYQLNPLDPHTLVGSYTSLSGASTETAQNLAGLTHDILDHGRTPTERFLSARRHSQAAGKLLFSITSIPAAYNLVTAFLPASTGIYAAAQRFGVSHSGRFMNDLLRIARPIGDTALLIGDGIHLHQTLHDPQATTGQQIRAGVDVGIDATRVASYLLPQTPLVRTVAGAALFARVGLGFYDMAVSHRPNSVR